MLTDSYNLNLIVSSLLNVMIVYKGIFTEFIKSINRVDTCLRGHFFAYFFIHKDVF